MKKIVSLLLVAFLLLNINFSLADEAVKIAALKGPTSMIGAKLFTDAKNSKTKLLYDFTMFNSADEIAPLLLKGELDIAGIPSNLASVLYNRTEGNIVTLGIAAYNVLYFAELGDSIKDIEDLKGKKILLSGKGTTPEATLLYLLSAHNLAVGEDLELIYTSEAQETIARLAKGEATVALLPQPFLTAALNQIDGLRVALNIEELFLTLDNPIRPVTGVFVATKKFVEENPEKLEIFLKEMEESAKFVTENTDEAVLLFEELDIVKAAIAKKAIPSIGLAFDEGEVMKAALTSYLELLYNFDPKLVGGELPKDDFYFEK